MLNIFKDAPDDSDRLKQSTVQCNEACQIQFSHLPDKRNIRVRGFFWLGFVADQIDKDIWDARDSSKPFTISFSVPRQFGFVSVEIDKVKWKPYTDVITSKAMVSIEVQLEDQSQLKKIQDFLVYRNKSFIRRSKRRLKKTLTEKILYVFWAFIAMVALMLGLIFLNEHFFEA